MKTVLRIKEMIFFLFVKVINKLEGFLRIVMITGGIYFYIASNAQSQIIINEIVTDPQRDWNDSEGGNGIPFDNQPGTGNITPTDEWLELYNGSSDTLDFISDDGWQLLLIDSTPDTLKFSDPGSAVKFVFSNDGSLSKFQPGEYLVIGNPPGSNMSNDIYLVLIDEKGTLIDKVELGDDPEGDGSGDGAPDGSAGGGNATDVKDEAIARLPNGSDSGNDVNDFSKQTATIGATNDFTTSVKDTPSSDSSQLIPKVFQLNQSFPNPLKLNSSTTEATISFDLQRNINKDIELSLYNLTGQVVRQMSMGKGAAGTNQVLWDGRDQRGLPVSSGIYWYQVKVGNFTVGRKLTVVR